MNDETIYDESDEAAYGAIDEKQAKVDIKAGIRAIKELRRTAGHNWINGWSIAVRGWRGLRELAFKRAGVREVKSFVYRDAMKALLQQAQYGDYNDIPSETRTAMTRLTDIIDQVDEWYAGLQVWERERWSNPQTIVKHLPPHLRSTQGHNKPPRPNKGKNKKGNPEAERLRAILLRLIDKYVDDPEEAKELRSLIYQEDRNDSLADAFHEDEDEGEE